MNLLIKIGEKEKLPNSYSWVLRIFWLYYLVCRRVKFLQRFFLIQLLIFMATQLITQESVSRDSGFIVLGTHLGRDF